MNHIVSDKDRAILDHYTSMIAAHMKASHDAGNQRQTVAEYRAMMLAINPYKFPAGYEPVPVASFESKRQLHPGLTASISIPNGIGPFPIIVHAHGHGLRAGRPPEYEPWIRFMSSYGFIVIFPDYRWAPEATFAEQLDDMMFAINWARENATSINGDPQRMILGGDSAGGGIAVAALMKTLDDPHGVRFVAFECVDGAINGPPVDRHILDRITPATPLPPTIIMVGSADLDTAAGEATAALALSNARKPFQLHIYFGVPHDFMKFPELDVMHQANDEMMKWLLKLV
ncbi:MAG: alpha/beta hydrolase [Janthinobacterium lividum]